MRYEDLDHDDLSCKLMNADADRYIKKSRVVYERLHELDKSLIKAHKLIFGRQDQTWVGGSESRRFYLWRLDEMWILVHDVRGVSWEAAPDVPMERIWELWDRYCEIVLGTSPG